MRFAQVSIGGRRETGRFLAVVAERPEAAGAPLAGTVRTNVARISEDRGALARGMTVLLDVNGLGPPLRLNFAVGLPEELPADETVMIAWCLKGASVHVG